MDNVILQELTMHCDPWQIIYPTVEFTNVVIKNFLNGIGY